MESDKDKMTDERNNEKRMEEYCISAQNYSSKSSNKNEKLHFLNQNMLNKILSTT